MQEWIEQIERIDAAGVVYVRMRRGTQSIVLRLTAPNVEANVLQRGRVRDVSYTENLGLSEAEAAAVARAYADRLERSAAGVVMSGMTDTSSRPSPVVQPAAKQEDRLDAERFALLTSGFTVLRKVLPSAAIEALHAGVDAALEATREAAANGCDLRYLYYDEATYLGTRCVYCWGDACVQLIENPQIRALSEAVVGPHRLFDMSAHRALPCASRAADQMEWWHRDIDVFEDSPRSIRYLWFFVLLDEFTADNGATWVLPGSQHIPNTSLPSKNRLPKAVQVLGQPGDVIVINPSTLHSVGHNVTARPRTLINVAVCHVDVLPLMDHWSIAGPSIQNNASRRLREMLGADSYPPDPTWSVLPPGWVTARRSIEAPPAERVLPIEQRGYQRSHHMRGGELRPDRPDDSTREDE